MSNKFPTWMIIGLVIFLSIFCICLVLLGVWVFTRSGYFPFDGVGQVSGFEEEDGLNDSEPTSTYTFVPAHFQTETPGFSIESTAGIFTATPNLGGITMTPTIPFELTPFRAAVGYRAPDFTAEKFEGGSITLSDLRGQYVVMDYWASWCPPCMEEIPFIQQIHEEYRERGLQVLGVNGIEGDDLNSVGDVIADESLTYTILLDRDDEISRIYNIQYLPTSIFIDANGIIREIVIGGITENEFRDKVETLMSGD
jgi:cytochrome c biogenesis protein CcmG, thiol:disulfide interchange protein DsbE